MNEETKTYIVDIKYSGTETFIVDAINEEQAIEYAIEQASETGDIQFEATEVYEE